MIRFSNQFLFSIAMTCLAFSAALGQQNLMDFNNTLKFARYLKASGQYDFASQEYERIHFMSPFDSTVIFEMVQNYRLNRQCDKLDHSYKLIENYILKFSSLSFTEEYLKFSITCKSEDERFSRISSLLDPELKGFYQLGFYWSTGNYDSIRSYFHQNKNLIEKSNPELFRLSDDFTNQKYKSPFKASLYSAILPGSGKAYSNNWGDALVSFLFVSMNAWTSYRAFHKKGVQSANGWIFGGLALSFYIANIYGSAKAAKKFNSDIKADFQNHAENIIHSYF